jgi:uncharacterized protein YndB with AHSA1/START domain
MWRWVLIVMGLLIVGLFGTCFYGYRKLAGGDNTVNVTVALPAEHAYAMLTDRDSLLAWLPGGTTVMPESRHALQTGDTIRVAAQTRGGSTGRAVAIWIVRELKPPTAIAIEGIEYDPGGVPHIAFSRRDSLVAQGDSTRIVSTFVASPLMVGSDSVRAASGAVTGSLLGAAERMRAGAARMLWETELRGLARR